MESFPVLTKWHKIADWMEKEERQFFSMAEVIYNFRQELWEDETINV